VTREFRSAERRLKVITWCLVLATVTGVLLYGGVLGLAWWIHRDAEALAAQARQEFPGDEVEAVLAFVQSPDRSLDERNRAVWALAQYGDTRALPVLEHFYSGGPCDHERFLCQRELRKAIDRSLGHSRIPEWLPLMPRGPGPR
jgi:hypothetical protein